MMKNLALILIFVLFITGCSGRAKVTEEGDSPPTDSSDNTCGAAEVQAGANVDTGGNVSAPVSTAGDGMPIPERWVTDNGAYFVATSNVANNIQRSIANPAHDGGWDTIAAFANPNFDNDAPLLLYINDSASGRNIVVCNRPECRHDSADCGAFIPPDELDVDDEWHFSLFKPRTGLLFVDGEYIYVSNGYNTIYRFNLDGSGRREQVRISGKYREVAPHERGWLLDGKLYVEAGAIVESSGIGGSVINLHAKTVISTSTPISSINHLRMARAI